MAKSIDLSTYDPVLFSVISQVNQLGTYEFVGTMQDCMALRFEIYAFRRALTRANHPDAIIAKLTSWYIQELPSGEAKLTGIRKDKSKLSIMARQGLLQTPIPVFGPRPNDMLPPPSTPDASGSHDADAILQMLKTARGDDQRTSDQLISDILKLKKDL